MGNLVLAPRRGSKSTMQTAAKKNIVLAAGELFIETDAGQVRLKVGDGASKYYQLPYVNSSAATAADVLYDNTVSEIPGAYNVQQAIDITYDKLKKLKAENIPVNTHGHIIVDNVQDALEHASEAHGTFYDNSTSGLAATDVQQAIDLLAAGSGGGGEYVYDRNVTGTYLCPPGATGHLVLNLSDYIDFDNAFELVGILGSGFTYDRIGNAQHVSIANQGLYIANNKFYYEFYFYNNYTEGTGEVAVKVFVQPLLRLKI